MGGTRAHFTELNRRHADLPADLPALTFSSTPQMHAVEPRQIVESIDVQRLTAIEAVRIADGRPVHIGPVTLRPRFNAVAASSAARPTGSAEGYAALDEHATDPRQASAGLAAWTVASAAAFAVPGVNQRLLVRGVGSAWAPPGRVRLPRPGRPCSSVLRLSGAEAVDAVGAPEGVHVLAGVTGDRLIALVANLRDDPDPGRAPPRRGRAVGPRPAARVTGAWHGPRPPRPRDGSAARSTRRRPSASGVRSAVIILPADPAPRTATGAASRGLSRRRTPSSS